MTFAANYNGLEKIYEANLTTIKNLKFTLRETDVLACIIHNRGEKKIAVLLSISPKTVSTHVYNIMSKTGCNSKDQIIDFIETSDKLIALREYYLHLLVKSNFEKQLRKVAVYSNRSLINCYCRREEVSHISNQFYQSIQKHFKMANIILLEATANEAGKLMILELSKITEDNYYNDLLEGLSKIIKSQALEEVIKEFNVTYRKLQAVYDGTGSNDPGDLDAVIDNKVTPALLRKKKIVIITSVLLLISLFLVTGIYTLNFSNTVKEHTIHTKTPEVIKDLEEFLEALKSEQFTADNVNLQRFQYNNGLIKKAEKLLVYKDTPIVQEYFKNMEMSPTFLINYLYNLHALASYYMRNAHDFNKARQILLHSKNLTEGYINSRSVTNIDFNKLTNVEIFSELRIIRDLPQMYTKVIYLLGRTYIYDSENMTEGIKYFELAKYLGTRLNLYEGYLSDVSGILIIEKELANLQIKEGNFQLAKQSLQNVIESYVKIRNDRTVYINNYKGNKEQGLVIPKEDNYTFFECGNRIIVCYSTLLSLSKSAAEIKWYIDEINRYIIGDKTMEGLYLFVDNILPRKVADLYNNLGNLMLTLQKLKEQENIDIKDNDLKKNISKILPKNDDGKNNLKDNFDYAEALFVAAKDISVNKDFTKADAYQGLAQLYSFRLERDGHNLTAHQKQELQNKLDPALEKSNQINRYLGRKQK
jgi:DNA-binding CsgD family transcriptional regulator